MAETFYRTYDQETRDYWDEHLEYNTLRQNPKTGWAAERSYVLEAAGDVLRELTGSTGFTRTEGQEKTYLNEKLNRLKRAARTVGADYTARVMATSPDFGPAEGQEAQLEKIRADIAQIKPKSEEVDLAKMILDSIASGDPHGLLLSTEQLRKKLGLLSKKEKDLDRLINEARPTDQSNLPAAIGAAAEASRLALTPDDETRPTDQPRLPPLLEGPPEEKTGKEPSKGRMFRGIGSLMRGRNVFSLIQALREGYELLPEEYQVLDEALQYWTDTLEAARAGSSIPGPSSFGIDKPGIEYFKEWLGSGETIPLPKVQKSEADRMSRSHKLGFTVDAYHYTAAPEDFEEFLAGGPDYKKASVGGGSALETGIQLSGPGVWFSSSPEDLESGAGWKGYRDVGHKKEGGRVIPARLRIEEPLYLDLFNQEEMADRWVEAAAGKPESLSWYKQEFPMILNQPTVDKLRAAGFDTIIDEGSGAGFDHKGGPEYIVLDTRNIRARSAKFDPEESKSADMSKAAGGFIDKPLYDDRRMIG